MIGKFIVSDTKDGESYCIAVSDMNDQIKAKLYIPPLYRDSVSKLSMGDQVFAVVDDASGFGAILFKFDDSMTGFERLTLSHDLEVKGEYIGSGTVSQLDVQNMFSAVQIVSPVGNCVITPITPMTVKFSKGGLP